MGLYSSLSEAAFVIAIEGEAGQRKDSSRVSVKPIPPEDTPAWEAELPSQGHYQGDLGNEAVFLCHARDDAARCHTSQNGLILAPFRPDPGSAL